MVTGPLVPAALSLPPPPTRVWQNLTPPASKPLAEHLPLIPSLPRLPLRAWASSTPSGTRNHDTLSFLLPHFRFSSFLFSSSSSTKLSRDGALICPPPRVAAFRLGETLFARHHHILPPSDPAKLSCFLRCLRSWPSQPAGKQPLPPEGAAAEDPDRRRGCELRTSQRTRDLAHPARSARYYAFQRQWLK